MRSGSLSREILTFDRSMGLTTWAMIYRAQGMSGGTSDGFSHCSWKVALFPRHLDP